MTRKFFERWSWFKFNNLGLVLGMVLKFYTSVSKRLKLKIIKFWGLIATFAEGEKLVEGPSSPPSWIWLNVFEFYMFYMWTIANFIVIIILFYFRKTQIVTPDAISYGPPYWRTSSAPEWGGIFQNNCGLPVFEFAAIALHRRCSGCPWGSWYYFENGVIL